MGSQRVGHDWATSLSLFIFMHWRRKWQPIPVFLPGESQGWRSLVGCRLWGLTESDTTESTSQQQQQWCHLGCHVMWCFQTIWCWDWNMYIKDDHWRHFSDALHLLPKQTVASLPPLSSSGLPHMTFKFTMPPPSPAHSCPPFIPPWTYACLWIPTR